MSEQLDLLFVAFQAAVAGRYSLERELGRGGMGIVYLAREVSLDRPVALKLLPPELAAHRPLRDRFVREARTAAKLSHPHIVQVFAVDEVGDFVFFVMAYVRGETLSQRVRSSGPLSPPEAARILREVAWALAYAHAQGVIHRDVKPDNILLEQATGRALVSDFGIAHLAHGSGATGVGELLGTAEFMSPEQASGEGVDGRSDLYSLGVVGYYILSGQLPFQGPTVAAVLAQQVTRLPPLLSSLSPGAPRKLTAVLERCLAKDPAARFESGEALTEAIELSLDRAEDMPASLRAFLAESDALSGPRLFFAALLSGVTLWFFLAILVFFVLRVTDYSDPLWVILVFVQVAVLAGVLLGPIGVVLGRVRRLLASGHGHDQLMYALYRQLERRRQDGPPAAAGKASRIARAGQKLWRGALFLAAISGFIVLFNLGLEEEVILSALAVFGVSVSVGVLGAALGLKGDATGALRAKFWAGRFGKWLFRVAGLGLRKQPLSDQAALRPTEVAIGMAAYGLFEGLPKEVRNDLRELPNALGRLEADAQRMRRRVEELNGLLAEAEPRVGLADALDARRRELLADLRAARDTAQDRLAGAVAALEMIRLDLLRLRAGAGGVDGLTADLAIAREISGQIDRLLIGQHEVETAFNDR